MSHWKHKPFKVFFVCVDQRFTDSWLNLIVLSSSWKDILTGFSNSLTVVLAAFMHHKTFLWETLVWLSIMKLHSIIRVTERLIHNILFFCTGGLWRTVGLCEESCICHRIWDLILGCIRQLAHMVGFPYKCNKAMNLGSERTVWLCSLHYTHYLIRSGMTLFYCHISQVCESILYVDSVSSRGTS